MSGFVRLMMRIEEIRNEDAAVLLGARRQRNQNEHHKRIISKAAFDQIPHCRAQDYRLSFIVASRCAEKKRGSAGRVSLRPCPMYDQGHPPGARARAATLARSAPSPNRIFARSPREAQAGRTAGLPLPSLTPQPRPAQNWPVEIAFLAQEGLAPELLTAVAAIAKTQGVSAEAALLATGLVSETSYYRALARHLGVYFIEGNVAIAPLAQYPQAIHAGVAPLDHLDHSAFIVAPRGASIATLIKSVPYGELRAGSRSRRRRISRACCGPISASAFCMMRASRFSASIPRFPRGAACKGFFRWASPPGRCWRFAPR